MLPWLGLRWRGFRQIRRQVCKRLQRRLRALALVDLTAYRRYLVASSTEWIVLDSLCRISISRFYRDRTVFDRLRDEAQPALPPITPTQVSLNASNQEVLVNFIEYWEVKGPNSQHFCWITDLPVTKINVFDLMRGGRARWKIENETFNTLKNQGYNFEHNYGHGQENLSVNFALLMMLAFLVDQVQQLAFPLFQAVLKKEGSRKRLWQHMRALFYTLPFPCTSSRSPSPSATRSRAWLT